VFTVIIKQVNVVTGNFGGQTCPHFGAENLVPQSLRFTNFVLMPRPAHLDSAFGRLDNEAFRVMGLRRMK
jgi:hypothetical protein